MFYDFCFVSLDSSEMLCKIICLIVVNLLSGISTQCSNEKRLPQWFMQFGTREIPSRDVMSSRVASISNSGSDSSKYGCSFPGDCLEEYIKTEVVKRSPLPMVLLGDKYYYFGTYFKTNYFKAMQFCEDHGMNLLSIETENENTNILKYLKENLQKVDHIWTSGTDLGEEGTFVWLSTGKLLNFTYWSPPQPDNAGKIENCLEIWKLNEKTYIWNDIPCTNNYNFICELKKCTSFCDLSY